MSAILAVCGTAFCAMVSDGRMVEEPITDGKIKVLTDALPKVRKLNRNVLVGFAGDAVAAAQIINKLDEYDVQYMTASTEDYAPQTQPARDGAYLIEGACSHTEVAPYLEQYVKPEAARWHTLDDIAKTLDGCIAKLAEADQTVNTKYFRELVM